jgi:hypothetical protein
MKTVHLVIYEKDINVYIGECNEFCVNTNIPEIADIPIKFWGNTCNEVIAQVKTYAKEKFGGDVEEINVRIKK